MSNYPKGGQFVCSLVCRACPGKLPEVSTLSTLTSVVIPGELSETRTHCSAVTAYDWGLPGLVCWLIA